MDDPSSLKGIPLYHNQAPKKCPFHIKSRNQDRRSRLVVVSLQEVLLPVSSICAQLQLVVVSIQNQSGVLSLPYAIKLNGIIPGIVAMLVAAAGSIWSMRLIVACSNATECRSFGKITQIGGGMFLSITLDIMILIYTTGVSITFIAISKMLFQN